MSPIINTRRACARRFTYSTHVVCVCVCVHVSVPRFLPSKHAFRRFFLVLKLTDLSKQWWIQGDIFFIHGYIPPFWASMHNRSVLSTDDHDLLKPHLLAKWIQKAMEQLTYKYFERILPSNAN